MTLIIYLVPVLWWQVVNLKYKCNILHFLNFQNRENIPVKQSNRLSNSNLKYHQCLWAWMWRTIQSCSSRCQEMAICFTDICSGTPISIESQIISVNFFHDHFHDSFCDSFWDHFHDSFCDQLHDLSSDITNFQDHGLSLQGSLLLKIEGLYIHLSSSITPLACIYL